MGNSVQEHMKANKEIFDRLSVIGDPIVAEDRAGQLTRSIKSAGCCP